MVAELKSNGKHAAVESNPNGKYTGVELSWNGKYTADGKRNSPLRVELPFQTVEMVNESVQERERKLMFSANCESEWRNRLIWGDKKYVLPSLLPEFAGKVKLIYIDPPFDTGADFKFQVKVEDEEFTKEPSIIEMKAYRDTWGRGLDGYLQWFYETALLLRELLAEDGGIYVHLDDHVSHYVKSVMDELFGSQNYINEIVWQRTNSHNTARQYGRIHDVLLFYVKGNNYEWNDVTTTFSPAQLSRYQEDENERWYTGQDLTASRPNSNSGKFEWRGTKPPSNRGWGYELEQLEKWWAEGLILAKKDGTPRMDGLKVYLDEKEGKFLQSIWTDVPRIANTSAERLGYPTQKPEALIERIIKSSSNEGDLVLDCFSGSGTTAAVAEKLNRRWITGDLGRFAVHTTRKRLLGIPNVQPFIVQNLGKYERQLWQQDEFGPKSAERIAAYTKFILDLYHAQPLTGFTWLHGIKGGRVVHVGAVDSPVTLADIKSIIIEWTKSRCKAGATRAEIDVLGWDFAFVNETAKQRAAEAGIDLRFHIIPREVLEKKAGEQGDIQLFELAALSVEHKVRGRELKLDLTNFIVPPDCVPPDIRTKIIKWESWIDYWAVDFDFKGDTFHNQWQNYRTRKDKTLQKRATHIYQQPGKYAVQVKVIDIFGNDTTRNLKVCVCK